MAGAYVWRALYGREALLVWRVHKLLILFQAKNVAPPSQQQQQQQQPRLQTYPQPSHNFELSIGHFMSAQQGAAATPTCSNYINCIDNLRLCCNFVHQLWLAINFDLAHINVGQKSCCHALRSSCGERLIRERLKLASSGLTSPHVASISINLANIVKRQQCCWPSAYRAKSILLATAQCSLNCHKRVKPKIVIVININCFFAH